MEAGDGRGMIGRGIRMKNGMWCVLFSVFREVASGREALEILSPRRGEAIFAASVAPVAQMDRAADF